MGSANAEVSVDIRTLSDFNVLERLVDYSLSVTDCQFVESLSITAGTYNDTQLAILNDNNTCTYVFKAEGDGYLDPYVNLKLKTGEQQSYAESFSPENQPPSINLEGVSFMNVEDQQHLIVSVSANDNVDISYLGFAITGLRASDLRAANGVIEVARKSAFALSNGVKRLYPTVNDQNQYQLSIPVKKELSTAEIASNGLVLYDIYAVDASLNTTSISGISFTGDDVNEEILGISIQPQSIVISNPLELVALVPTVSHQFSEPTPRPGARQGFTYTPYGPSILQVTEEGLLTALQETNGADVSIDRKSTRLNSSHRCISYAVFCLKKKNKVLKQLQ